MKYEVEKKIWQKNEQGDEFWDTYLHPECVAVGTSVSVNYKRDNPQAEKEIEKK